VHNNNNSNTRPPFDQHGRRRQRPVTLALRCPQKFPGMARRCLRWPAGFHAVRRLGQGSQDLTLSVDDAADQMRFHRRAVGHQPGDDSGRPHELVQECGTVDGSSF
jgi:hypothetical protein